LLSAVGFKIWSIVVLAFSTVAVFSSCAVGFGSALAVPFLAVALFLLFVAFASFNFSMMYGFKGYYYNLKIQKKSEFPTFQHAKCLYFTGFNANFYLF